MNKQKHTPRASAVTATVLYVALFAVACGPSFSLGEHEQRVDAPAQMVFQFRFAQNELDYLAPEDWPALTLELSVEDAEALGAPSEIPFMWSTTGAQAAVAVVKAQNFWQETDEQVTPWPCFQGPIYVALETSERFLAYEPGHCPQGSSVAVEDIDAAQVLSLIS